MLDSLHGDARPLVVTLTDASDYGSAKSTVNQTAEKVRLRDLFEQVKPTPNAHRGEGSRRRTDGIACAPGVQLHVLLSP